ncbi:hypothetical protein F5972_12375 [Microbispora cellulosiformans]|uniref:Uncharacterized protein n=1 Tax=Microbispora cellulosiformans TaxID=2614688 RepID=A0A5J5K3N2_9ACTN|nr:hypothetical protein [Microbispora cellulosiformans]KAA9379013.1 hypothetical protein F5972_12375 [Microbispora cellulosiformans]
MPRSTSRRGRAAALAAAAATAPAAVWVVHPVLSTVIAGLGAAAGLAVVITALFGSDRFSERAFRLLRWLADRPEPSKRDRG